MNLFNHDNTLPLRYIKQELRLTTTSGLISLNINKTNNKNTVQSLIND